MKFKNEKEFQIWLGRKLEKLGFKVYTDKKICELPTFHGDLNKPDLLIFFNQNKIKCETTQISNPFFIETKIGKFNKITNCILQLRKYFNKKYWVQNKRNLLTAQTFLLATPSTIFNGIIYPWSAAKYQYQKCDKNSFYNGIHWATLRFIYSLADKKQGDFYPKQFCGILKLKRWWNKNFIVMEFPHGCFPLVKNGIISREYQDLKEVENGNT